MTISHKTPVNLLQQLDALSFVHNGPDVTEAAVVDGTFDDDGHDTGEHETNLNYIGPHHSLHTTLETTHRQPLISVNQSIRKSYT